MNFRGFSTAPARRLLPGLLAIFALSAPVHAGPTVIDIKDWFPLAPDSFWHYTGDGQPNSSPDDDFTWEVQDLKKDVGGGVMATQIKTLADETDDARHNDLDYWYTDPDDPEGKLLFYGIYNAVADTGFPVQDIVLEDPLSIGGNGQMIGDVVEDSGSVTVMAGLPPFIPLQSISGTIRSRVTYQEIVPEVDTPLGTFTDVLRLIIEFTVVVDLPFPVGEQEYEIRGGEFFLDEGHGMILQDQDRDLNDAESQIIDGGQVNGQAIQPDVIETDTAATDWLLYR